MIGEKGFFRFRREEHLKGRKEIKEVFGKGKRYNCRGAKLFVLKNDLPYNRICFTFSKVSKRDMSFWNAVSRNRARRLGREAFRLLKCRLSTGHDLILLIYPDTEGDPKKISLCDRAEQLDFLFTKAGLLK